MTDHKGKRKSYNCFLGFKRSWEKLNIARGEAEDNSQQVIIIQEVTK